MAMERIYVTTPQVVLKGAHQGENLARCICFPIDGLKEQYGEGTWTIVFRRPFESDPYVVANQEEVGEYAVWGMDATDTAVAGAGRVELRYYVDETLCKTDVYAVLILPSLGETGDAPSPYEDIIDTVAGYVNEAKEAVATVPETVAEMQAQLDEAISGVTEDSEVINARVDAEGTTYSTLKQRLDAENTELKSDLNDIGYIDHDPPSTSGTWVQGAIDSSSGIIFTGAAARADRIADETFYKTSEIKKIEVGTGFQILCGNYTSASVDGYVNVTSWATSYDNFSENYVRFSVRRTNGNNILPTESTGFVLTYKDVPVNEAVTALMESAEQTNLELSELDLSRQIAPNDYGVASKNQIARLGWNVYSPTTPPEQSIESYKLAYKNGCRIMLCDVRVTQDGRFVLWHDATLNTTVKHMDGTALSASELAMTIAGSTLAELNAFDYGVYKGAEYAGRGIPTLSNFLVWCSLYNCIPMLEIKVELTEAECVYIAKLCKCFGLGDRVIIDEYLSNLVHTVNYWITNLPKSTVCIIAGTSINSALTVASTIKNAGMSTLLTLSTAAQLEVIQTDGNIDFTKVQAITDTGTNLTYTEIQSDSEMRSFYNGGYLSVFQYIASSYVNVKKWIHDNI